MKFVSIPYNDFIYEIFIYEMLCEIFVRVVIKNRVKRLSTKKLKGLMKALQV